MKLKHIPNIITIIRFILIIPVAICMLQRAYTCAFLLFFIAAISDGVDGYLARRFQWTSRFGAIADPLADKLLMIVSYLCLAITYKIPLWLLIVVVFRDLWLVLGVLAYWHWIGDTHFTPSRISKLNTFVQLIFVIAMLWSLGFIALPSILIETLIYLVLITTVSSFIDYTWVWGRRAIAASKVHCNE